MKTMLFIVGLFTAVALAACGGGGSSGHSQAWQDGYNTGVEGGSKPEGAGGHVTSDFWCQSLSASYQGNGNDFVAGCMEGFAKGQATPSPTEGFTPPFPGPGGHF